VAADENQGTNRALAGLCADCRNARKLGSDRGSIFYLCEHSKVDPAFPKYPRLPVLQCSAYAREA
jgi:hypothetical protein